jgi:hypothetical protein
VAGITLAARPPLFETLRWTAPGEELVALSTQPNACLVFDPVDQAMVRAGQALFNSPTLLGGQAAKAGLSCASCHVNGRDSPHFELSGVSAAPGTADVTNSFFSAARGNARFDPAIIPDLAKPGKISRDPKTGELPPFIRTLIVEEFGGREPSSAMLEALSHYVRAIRICEGGEVASTRTLDDQLLIIDAALVGATEMAERRDAQASQALIAAARHQLGLVSERYAGSGLARERQSMLLASRKLQAIGEQADEVTIFTTAISQWKGDFDAGLAIQLRRSNQKSLYNPRLLGEALNQ